MMTESSMIQPKSIHSLGPENGGGFVVGPQGYKNHFRFGHIDRCFGFVPTPSADPNLDRQGSAPNSLSFGIEAQHVANEYRMMKNNLVHGDGDESAVGLPYGFHIGRLVNQRQNDPAKNGAFGVGIARHHDDANRRFR